MFVQKRGRTDGGSEHEKEPEGGREGVSAKSAGFTGTTEAYSSATCLNGTQAGARTVRLRLIGHSNATRPLP